MDPGTTDLVPNMFFTSHTTSKRANFVGGARFFPRHASAYAAIATMLAVVLLVACGPSQDRGTLDPSGQSADSAALQTAGNDQPTPLEIRRRLNFGSIDNVILVTIDTWRYDAAGFAGNPSASTPLLDRLAKSGVNFTRSHAHSVLTFPSHANILTGTLPYVHGVRDNAGFTLKPDRETLAELLKAGGFRTGAVVAAFPLDSIYGLDQGFDLYDDSFPKGDTENFSAVERSGREVVDHGLRWWSENKGNKRFLWLHLYEPHAPYDPPSQFVAKTEGKPYLGEVAAADSYLSDILEPLLAGTDKAATNTLVVVTGDHGESLGEHGEASHGLFAYDATLRVPLLMWAHGLESEVTSEPASHIDIAPTILDAVGISKPALLSGRSLLESPPTNHASHYFEALHGVLQRGWAPLRGVIDSRRTDDWHASKFIELPIPELYDLDRDPGELTNLLPKGRDRSQLLRAQLPNESQWPPEAGAISEEERKALESLGYISAGGRTSLPSTFTAADDPKTLVELDAMLHRFIDLYREGQLVEATQVARTLVSRRPQMGLGHYHLAQALLERGDKREALRVLSDAYRAGATTPALIRQLVLSLSEAGRHEEALRILEPLVSGGELETLLAYARARASQGDVRGSRETLASVLERDPDNSQAFEILSMVSVEQGEWKRAESEARKSLDSNPRLSLPWNYLGIALYNQGQRNQALDAWKESLRLEPEDFDVLFNYAVVSAEAGRRQEAKAALQRFIDEAPQHLYGQDKPRAKDLLQRLGG